MAHAASRSESLATLFAAVAVLALGACGGTPPPPPPPPSPSPSAHPEGIWKDATQALEPRYVLVEPDGQTWGIPSVIYLSTIPTVSVAFEALKGQLTLTGNNVTGTYNNIVARDCAPIFACNFAGLSSGGQLSLAGTKNASGTTIPNVTFSGAAQGTYVAQATVAQVTGTWFMKAAMPSDFGAQGQLFVTLAGVMTVPNISGCSFTGQLTPVAGKGYFRIAASAVNGTCATGTTASQINGVVFKITETSKPPVLHVMWHNADQSQYFWSAGTN